MAEKMKKVREKNILLSSKPDNEVIQMIECAADQRQWKWKLDSVGISEANWGNMSNEQSAQAIGL